MHVLEHYNVKLENLSTVILGNGILVGQPLSVLLKKKKADVTVCTIDTKNTKQIV